MLEKEIETYEKHLSELLAAGRDKWVLIKGETIIGTFADELQGLHEGYRRFPREAFLYQQILPEQPIEFIGGGAMSFVD